MDVLNSIKNINVKKEFSNTLKNSDYDFQTANMENKMKNIKKRNKQVKQNYKNIETFNTLDNKKPERKKKKKNNKKETVESFNNINNNNKLIETVCTQEDLKDRNNRDCYEGHDDVKEAEEKTFKDKLEALINAIYDKPSSLIRNTGSKFADALSNGDATNKDKELISDYFVSLVTALVTFPITYNWYFLMYYTQDDSSIELAHLSIAELKEKAKSPSLSIQDSYYKGIISFVLWFFEFAIMFPSAIDLVFTQLFPSITHKYLSGRVKFMLVFFIIYQILRKVVPGSRTFFLDLLNGGVSPIIGVMYAIIVLTFIVNFIQDMMDINERQMFINGWPVTVPLLFLRFVIIMLISVPLGSVSTLFYFIIYSIFGICIYSPISIGKILDKIHSHSDIPAKLPSNETCEGEGFIMKFLRILLKVFGMFKTNVVTVLIFCIAIFHLFKLNTELSNASGMVSGISLKESFIFFNMLLIIVVGLWLYMSFGDKTQEIFNDKKIDA